MLLPTPLLVAPPGVKVPGGIRCPFVMEAGAIRRRGVTVEPENAGCPSECGRIFESSALYKLHFYHEHVGIRWQRYHDTSTTVCVYCNIDCKKNIPRHFIVHHADAAMGGFKQTGQRLKGTQSEEDIKILRMLNSHPTLYPTADACKCCADAGLKCGKFRPCFRCIHSGKEADCCPDFCDQQPKYEPYIFKEVSEEDLNLQQQQQPTKSSTRTNGSTAGNKNKKQIDSPVPASADTETNTSALTSRSTRATARSTVPSAITSMQSNIQATDSAAVVKDQTHYTQELDSIPESTPSKELPLLERLHCKYLPRKIPSLFIDNFPETGIPACPSTTPHSNTQKYLCPWDPIKNSKIANLDCSPCTESFWFHNSMQVHYYAAHHDVYIQKYHWQLFDKGNDQTSIACPVCSESYLKDYINEHWITQHVHPALGGSFTRRRSRAGTDKNALFEDGNSAVHPNLDGYRVQDLMVLRVLGGRWVHSTNEALDSDDEDDAAFVAKSDRARKKKVQEKEVEETATCSESGPCGGMCAWFGPFRTVSHSTVPKDGHEQASEGLGSSVPISPKLLKDDLDVQQTVPVDSTSSSPAIPPFEPLIERKRSISVANEVSLEMDCDKDVVSGQEFNDPAPLGKEGSPRKRRMLQSALPETNTTQFSLPPQAVPVSNAVTNFEAPLPITVQLDTPNPTAAPSPSAFEDDGLVHSCDQCPKVFKGKPQLRRHIIQYHSDFTAIPCDMCGLTFSRRDAMMRHKKKNACRAEVSVGATPIANAR
ncbi:hypothetical protein HDU78_000227 [Chytriomyces hyalinus]|nr:hypothetical protein HDU78_000227 [Chytriomyces hyalinus]